MLDIKFPVELLTNWHLFAFLSDLINLHSNASAEKPEMS